MSGNILIDETFINRTEGYRFGETGPYESFTDNKGELYKSLVREYGRCTGKVYVDRKGKPPMAIGWVFLKREKYDDTGEPYLKETWVALHEKQPDVKTEYHYLEV